MEIEIKLAYDRKREIRELFSEYTNMLIDMDTQVAEYLSVQNYEDELENLSVKYGMPYGRLYIAEVGGEPAGCVALRKLDHDNGEIKRLFVRPSFRGNKIGNQLMELVLEEAKKVGYKSVYLDTLPFLKEAIHMYEKLGFCQIDSYNNSPMESAVYMKKELNH